VRANGGWVLIIAGLVLILLGWIAQLVRVLASGQRNLSGILLVPYGLGCLLLAIGGYLAGDWLGAALNTACVLIPVAIIVIILRE
jgi:hypothetical protein